MPAFLAAGGGQSQLVSDLGLCLVGAAVFSILFMRLRIPAIAALLGAGVLLGPTGLEAIDDRGSIETIANLGLTLLLYVIGLEVNVESLRRRGRVLLTTGLLQVPLTLAVGLGVFAVIGLTGWGLMQGDYLPLYLGVACAFSSTLLVVKYLQEHLLADTLAGRLSVGLLIFQDVWAIVFLALQPSFSNPSVGPIVMTFVGIAIVGVFAWLAARFVMVHAFHIVARSPELVVTVALGWCFGVGLFGANLSTLSHMVGLDVNVNVSMEMAALIAGASIGTTPYAYEVVSRVVHLRDFFVTLFFVGLGMSIPVPDGWGVLAAAAVLGAVAILLRLVVFLPLLVASGLDRRNAVTVSAKLAQISEFCLVIAYLGARHGHLDHAQVSIVIFAFVLTALLTPAFFKASDGLYRRLTWLMDRVGMRARETARDRDGDEPPRLVLLGFHRVGSALLADVKRLHRDLLPHTLVVDTNVAYHAAVEATGAHVLYGDLASMDVLKHARVGEAEVIVSTVADELLKGTTNEQLVRQLRQLAPRAAIFATATKISQVEKLRAAGADYVYRAPTEVALGMLPAIYAALNANLPSYVEAFELEHGRLEHRAEVID